MTCSPATRLLLGVLAALVLGTACAPKRVAPPPAAGAPRFPDFIFPSYAPSAATSAVGGRHEAGWRWLQAGDLRAAEREFELALKEAPGFFPARTGLGYVGLARKEPKAALAHFDRALQTEATYAPALAGRAEAQLALGNRSGALASFESALAIDPGLPTIRARIDALRFRVLEDDIAAARRAAEGGSLAEARHLYQRALSASPESPFLHRELAAVERRDGNLPSALAHAVRASELDPNEPRTFILLGEIYEGLSEYGKAAEAYSTAASLEPNEALNARVDALREKMAFAALPPEYQAVETSETVTRAQLAAVLGVQLDALLKRAKRRPPIIMTDTRGSWAAPWIMSVTRAGIMEPFPNHSFQPTTVVRRGDLADAASRTLALIAAERPRLGAAWRNARRRFPDLAPGHLSYPAASMAVEAGVMTTAEDGGFQLARPVTGAEAMKAVRRLRELAESASR